MLRFLLYYYIDKIIYLYIISTLFTYTIAVKSLSKLSKIEKLKLFSVLGVILTVILVAINHFVYEWTGNNTFIGIFVATNESLWEHIKLALFPMFLIFLVGGFLFYKKVNNYFLAVFCALSVTILFIVFAFMGYTVYARKSILPFDIAIFIIGIALGYFTAYEIFFKPRHKILNILSVFGILLIVALFLTCTYHAPEFFIFEELYVNH